MADPATITLAVKAAIAAATDERTWKVIGVIIAAILAPFIIIIMAIASIGSGAAEHNNAAVRSAFLGSSISANAPAEYRQSINDIQRQFSFLDSSIGRVNGLLEFGSLDSTRVKAVFYARYFGQDDMNLADCDSFADSFVRYEERTRTVTDDDGNETEETYTVAIELPLAEVFQNLGLTGEQVFNSSAIYNIVLFGDASPDISGVGYDEWQAGIFDAPPLFIGENGFASPLGADWRSLVTSEFGWRQDPFDASRGEGHYGLDMRSASGTPIRAARDGVVAYVKYGNTGYGYHIVIDHGDGMVTLYAHCSAIYVKNGQQVVQGDIISAVGTTGRSTGNHLHFEVRIGGKYVAPRTYLP